MVANTFAIMVQIQNMVSGMGKLESYMAKLTQIMVVTQNVNNSVNQGGNSISGFNNTMKNSSKIINNFGGRVKEAGDGFKGFGNKGQKAFGKFFGGLLSTMFLMQQLKMAIQNFFKTSIEIFKNISSNTNEFVRELNGLTASINFFKYSFIEAFSQTGFIDNLSEKINELSNWFNSLDEDTQESITTGLAYFGVLAGILGIVAQIAILFLTPFGALIGLLMIMGILVYFAIKQWDNLSLVAKLSLIAIMVLVGALIIMVILMLAGVTGAALAIPIAIALVVGAIIGFIIWVISEWEDMGNVMKAVVVAVLVVIGILITTLVGIVPVIILIVALVIKHWDWLKKNTLNIFKNIGIGIVNIFIGAINTIINNINKLIDFYNGLPFTDGNVSRIDMNVKTMDYVELTPLNPNKKDNEFNKLQSLADKLTNNDSSFIDDFKSVGSDFKDGFDGFKTSTDKFKNGIEDFDLNQEDFKKKFQTPILDKEDTEKPTNINNTFNFEIEGGQDVDLDLLSEEVRNKIIEEEENGNLSS